MKESVGVSANGSEAGTDERLGYEIDEGHFKAATEFNLRWESIAFSSTVPGSRWRESRH